MNDWLPIETAPHDGRRVLLYYPTFSDRREQIGHYRDHQVRNHGIITHSDQGWRIEGGHLANYSGAGAPKPEPTHWMPLPDPPESS